MGEELCLWGAGAILAGFGFGVLPSLPVWAPWALVFASTASLVVALRPPRRRWPWLALGFCAAGAVAAASGPLAVGEGRVPVRFSGFVREGWRQGESGWSTRLRLESWEASGLPFKPRRELVLSVGGSANPENLPAPGMRVEGAGELVQRSDGPQVLWVKTPLLLAAQGCAGGADGLRQKAAVKLAEAAGFSLARQRAAGVAAALVLGRREGLAADETQSLRQAGLGHLLAVSGLHVGIVASLFWLVFLLAGLRPAVRRWLLLPIVVGFALLSGGAAPVRRAASATVLVLLARQVGRPLELLPVFWAVVGLLVLAEPAVVWEPGFQLSAGVALALVRWVPVLASRWGKGRLATAGFVALLAQLASAPLVGVHFGVLPPLGMVCNFLASPVAFFLVACSLGALGAAWVWPLLAGAFLDGVGVGWLVLQRLAALGDAWVWAFPPLPPTLGAVLAFLYVAALLPWRRGFAFGLGVLGLAAAAVVAAYVPRSRAPQLAMLPVRQGMALWVAGRQGSLLVDAGRGQREALAGLAALGGGRLSALALTHPDADHIGGAELVLAALRPKLLLLPEAFLSRPELVPVRWEALKRGVRVVPLAPGQRVALGDVVCDVLWPPAEGPLGDNDASLVLRCQLAGFHVLVVGDLEVRGERKLMATGQPLAAEILQVGHHGSRTSTSQEFLHAVKPRVAVVPTGTSPHLPFPHKATVLRVRQAHAVPFIQNQGARLLAWGGGRLELRLDPPVFVGGRRE
ncbi:MAG: DNA internalization-related competence protein ComEC/Rec2 [Thermoanaerobaculum sp.]